MLITDKKFSDYDTGSRTSGEQHRIQKLHESDSRISDYDSGQKTNCSPRNDNDAVRRESQSLHIVSKPRLVIIRARITHDKS